MPQFIQHRLLVCAETYDVYRRLRTKHLGAEVRGFIFKQTDPRLKGIAAEASELGRNTMPKNATGKSSDGTTATGATNEGSNENQSKSAGSGSSTLPGADAVKQVASQAKDTATNLLGQVKGQAASQVDQQKQTLASGIQTVAQAFQTMGEELRKKEAGPVGDYAAEIGQAIGGQVEQVATYLRERDLTQLLSETEGFARRSPAVFLGGAFVVGLAASRFLKSSRSSSSTSSGAANPSSGATPGAQLALPPASTPSISATSVSATPPSVTAASPTPASTVVTSPTSASSPSASTGSSIPAEFPFGPSRTSPTQPGATASETTVTGTVPKSSSPGTTGR